MGSVKKPAQWMLLSKDQTLSSQQSLMRYVIASLLRVVKAIRLWHVVMAQLSAVSNHGSHAEVVGVVYSNREMTTTEFVVNFCGLVH